LILNNMGLRLIRKKRVRAKIFGTDQRPRLSVFRSNRHIFLQIIDDKRGVTLVSASDQEIKNKDKKMTKVEVAKETGKILGQRALEKKIKEVVFDRNGYRYHGRVRAVAEGARDAGLVF